MKTRLFIVLLVVIGLLAAMSSAAAAQAPSGSDRPGFAPIAVPELSGPPIGPEQSFDPEGVRPWGNPVAGLHAQSAMAPDAPTVAIGQPGLSFRYVRTYGETLVPYLADNSHLFRPWGVTTDSSGNVFITEQSGSRMMKFAPNGDFLMSIGQAGVWLANNTDRISSPRGVGVDSSGSIWIAEGANRVSKWDATGKYVSQLGQTWNGGSDNNRFNGPNGIAFDNTGRLYVVDNGNQRIQVFDSGGSYVATLGDGTCGPANNQFCDPQGIAVDNAGRIYVADQGNERIQIFDAARNYLTSLGVTGTCGQTNNLLCDPSGVAIGPDGKVYVSDSRNNRVQIFSPYPALSYIATLGVTGQWGSDNAHFGWLIGVSVDASGNIYVIEEDNSRVQKFDSNRNYVRTFGVTGVPYLTDNLHFEDPVDAAVDPSGNLIVLEDAGQRFVKLDPNGASLFTVGSPGNPSWSESGLCWPNAIATDGIGRIYLANSCSNRIQVYDRDGAYLAAVGTGYGTGNTQFKSPQGVVVGTNGYLYVADTDNHRIQVFDGSYNYVATIGQTGVAGTDNAHFNRPMRPALDQAGNIYVADANNFRVQKCTLAGVCTTFAGVTGVSGWDNDHFSEPDGVAVDKQSHVYVVDQHNGRVQVYDQTGAYLTTLGGSRGTATGQNQNPRAVEVDADGNVYIVDPGNHRIQKFAPGVPGWRQVNINGFGDRNASWMSSLLPFQGTLYATGSPARIWRMTAAGAWSQVNTDGFGDNNNREIDALAEFDGQLYAAAYNWVCDDVNCNTGHSTSPQVWRSADGATWDNVTPAGGFGAGAIWVNAFVVFNNQLYMSIAGDITRGAQVWRTPDGTSWTRVVENGFANDVYNYQPPSLAVFNGNLYAGTGHGDWYNDGHPDGPLGGEVWRSSDGTTWTKVNASGFGTLEAYRVESLLVFQNGLYAYVSHVGGSAAGADVWRCTKTVCSEQGDWAKVMDNGFGMPQNQFLTSGAVSGAHLYAVAVTYNLSTGMQLWRTANGTDWEKATPYDGLGNSNNVYAYRGAMTDFNGRLTLGVTNWASGIGVWQKTLTADFTATPTRGAPPLTVQFTNTSSGDFTTSQWDFGDGGTSTEANSTHTYTAAGTYAVTLTVGDGTETSTVTKAGYIVAKHFTYLPVVMKNYDSLRYDDFNNTAYDGSWNSRLWSFGGESYFHAEQHDGVMVLWNTTPAGTGGAWLNLVKPGARELFQVQMYEARLKMSSNRSGGWSDVSLHIYSPDIAGRAWITNCELVGHPTEPQASIRCHVRSEVGDSWSDEYTTKVIPVDYDTWRTVRLEANPTTVELRFYVDGTLIGTHTPNDATALKAATNLRPWIEMWSNDPNAASTRYVDDVRITPSQ